MNMISLAGTRLCVEASDEYWRDATPYFVQNPQRLAKQGGVGGIMPRNQKRLLVHCPILDNKELVEARALGQRVAEVAVRFKSGSAQ